MFIYHFFLENYPSLRESGGDYYNKLRMVWLPNLFAEENLRDEIEVTESARSVATKIINYRNRNSRNN